MGVKEGVAQHRVMHITVNTDVYGKECFFTGDDSGWTYSPDCKHKDVGVY